MSIRRAQQEVDSREFLKHVANYQLYGRSGDNIQLQLANLSLMFFNANRGKAKAMDNPEDFMIRTRLYDELVNGTEEQQAANKMEATMLQFTQAFNMSGKENLKSHKERR